MTAGKIYTGKRQHPNSRQRGVLPEPEQKVLDELTPVTITTPDGEVFEIDDAPVNLGQATVLASEQTLRKFWDNPQEDEAWRIMSGEV